MPRAEPAAVDTAAAAAEPEPEPELEPEPEPEPEGSAWSLGSLLSWTTGGGASGAGDDDEGLVAADELVQAGYGCVVPDGASRPGLTLFDAAGGMRWGCTPVLRADWEQRLHVRQTPVRVTPTQLATAWCDAREGSPHEERCWERAAAVLDDRASLLSFEWRSHDGQRRVTCTATPIGFVAGGGNSFGIVVGKPAIGTAYRRAKFLLPTEQWKSHALANCYHAVINADGGAYTGGATARLHIYRHGVVGFGEPSTPEMRSAAACQLKQLYGHAAAAQEHDGLPQRVVSINLMDHTLESAMIRRQHEAWQTALGRTPGSPIPHAVKGTFAELQLPCNTDQAVLGWSKLDYERHLNFDAALHYLKWIVEDLSTILSRLLLPRGLDEGASDLCRRAGAARWGNVPADQRPSWLDTLRSKCLFDAGSLAATVSKIVGTLHPDYEEYIHAALLNGSPMVEPQPPQTQTQTKTHDGDDGAPAGSGGGPSDGMGWERFAEQLPKWTATAARGAKRRAERDLQNDDVGGAEGTSLRQFVHSVLLLLHAVLLLVHNFAVTLADATDEGAAGSAATGESDNSRTSAEKALLGEVERARAAIHCLDVFCMVELGLPCEQEGSEDSTSEPWRQEAERGSGGRRQPFSRTTSLATCALLNHTLGAAVFCNCKSGLDRTGLFCGMQISVSALWENYPSKRWETLMTACVDFTVLAKPFCFSTFGSVLRHVWLAIAG